MKRFPTEMWRKFFAEEVVGYAYYGLETHCPDCWRGDMPDSENEVMPIRRAALEPNERCFICGTPFGGYEPDIDPLTKD